MNAVTDPCSPEVAQSASGDPLAYQPNGAGLDLGRYDPTDAHGFRGDPVATAGPGDLPQLAASPAWEDRVRAEVLRQRLRITLPDQFPCIFETADSPSRAGAANPAPHPWVVSPDIAMLRDLINDYQELWDAYTAQWGPQSRRTFAVGRLDGLSPHGLYRPGTTPEQVIGTTMLTHSDMYGRAPERLRRMHPRYADWNRPTGVSATAGGGLVADVICTHVYPDGTRCTLTDHSAPGLAQLHGCVTSRGENGPDLTYEGAKPGRETPGDGYVMPSRGPDA